MFRPGGSAEKEHDYKVNSDSLRRWVVAYCIIRFDLELGQVIEDCYPPGCLSHEEELAVAFSSFPDSISQNQNRSSVHDCIFFFRIQRRSSQAESSQSDPDSYLYGYVFNRQRHDERLKRGGEQKSIVILSQNPFSCVFRPLLQIMGPLYFDIGKKAIEQIASCVSSWEAPAPGKSMELPIGNASLKAYLPPSYCLPAFKGEYEEYTSSVAPPLASNQLHPHGLFHDADIFSAFRGILMQLWLLWELLLIGEPILVIGLTPSQCSEAVASLISLVSPLLFSVDFRPYFTIHDPTFGGLNALREGDEFPRMLLGVTNLFFLKALRGIRHVVSVGSPTYNSNRTLKKADSGRIPNLRHKLSPLNILNSVKLKRDGPLSLMTEHKESIWTDYIAITKPDTSVLNRLIDAGISQRVEESMSVVNNEILRRHFLELTTNFLTPFGPYFKATTPSEGNSPFVDPPPLRPFEKEEFLKGLSARGVGKFLSKRMRSNWIELYKRFLDGPNFEPWFSRRRSASEREQMRLWMQARFNCDVRLFLPKISELEAVDSFNAIEKHLLAQIQVKNSGRRQSEVFADIQKLRKDLMAVFEALPKDMQELLLMNPERSALLDQQL